MADPSARLAELVSNPSGAYDRIMAVVASVAPDAPTEEEIVGRFDDLAAGLVSAGDPEDHSPRSIVDYTFGELGFVGNVGNYYSPSNSFIHRILDRRRGIPLTLAAVAFEIGHRVGVQLSIVGLPGHVIIGDGPEPQNWFDPFAAGTELDGVGCRGLFEQMHPGQAFDLAMLRPIDTLAVTTRMLNNLRLIYRQAGNMGRLAAVLQLTVALPGIPPSLRHEMALVLASAGRFDDAVEQLELLVTLDPPRADKYRREMNHHLARRN